jgi:hypothetical protein
MYILTGVADLLRESCKFNKYIPTELVALLKESCNCSECPAVNTQFANNAVGSAEDSGCDNL